MWEMLAVAAVRSLAGAYISQRDREVRDLRPLHSKSFGLLTSRLSNG